MFSETQQKVLAIYDLLYLEGPKDAYQALTHIIADGAAAWSTARLAVSYGKVLAAGITPADTIDRDLSLLRVENSLDEVRVYRRTIEKLRTAGLSEDLILKIDENLRAVTGGNVPGQSNKNPGS